MPIRREPAGDPDLLALVVRAGFGFDTATWHEASELGYDAWLARQLDPDSIPDDALDARLAAFPSLQQSAEEISNDFHAPGRELREACVLRAVFSRRVLFERTVEFWNDHFNVDQAAGMCRALKTPEEREAIRAHAFGAFAELLRAVTKSAAMLEYLGNKESRKEAPNENFARELLELHTLGVGHYDERDVKEVARCFTGWTFHPLYSGHFGAFTFTPEWHDDGAKTVLGAVIPAGGGEDDGERVLALLVRHPATARRIATKLATHFLCDEPPSSVVGRAARAFTATGGDVRAMLRVVLARESIALARASGAPKYKRPFAFVAALLRAADAKIENARGLCRELVELGHAPYAWGSPDGYPETRATWESALLSRWTFAERLFGGAIEGVQVDVDALLAAAPRERVAEVLDARFSGGTSTEAERRVVQARADAGASAAASCTLAACWPSLQEVRP